MNIIFSKSWINLKIKNKGETEILTKMLKIEEILQSFEESYFRYSLILLVKITSGKDSKNDISVCSDTFVENKYTFLIGKNVINYTVAEITTFLGHEFSHLIFKDNHYNYRLFKNQKILMFHVLSEVRADLNGKLYSKNNCLEYSTKFILPLKMSNYQYLRNGYLSDVDRKHIIECFDMYDKSVIIYVFELLKKPDYSFNYTYKQFLSDVIEYSKSITDYNRLKWVKSLTFC